MATGTNAIATNKDIKNVYNNVTTVGADNYCPTYEVIKNEYRLTVRGTYSNDELVKYSDLAPIEVPKNFIYIGFRVTSISPTPSYSSSKPLAFNTTINTFTTSSSTTPNGALPPLTNVSASNFLTSAGYCQTPYILEVEDISGYYGVMSNNVSFPDGVVLYTQSPYSQTYNVTKGTMNRTIVSPGRLAVAEDGEM